MYTLVHTCTCMHTYTHSYTMSCTQMHTHTDTGSISSEVQGHPSDQPALVHQYPTHRHHAIHEAKAPRQSKL